MQDEPCSSKSNNVPANNFKRGHRRAWSMPSAKGEKMTLAVIHDQETMQDGNTHHRRVVRYRLHPAKKARMIAGKDDPMEKTNFDTPGIRFDLSNLPNPEDDDHELEVTAF
ncbi:unnamed protein product [Cylicostephanus goldi]|uniref:Uncharacterized protein n=1 Tax=Cylicostephanus goldi TaxID=71465 RepID=A0A3P6RKX6_CYLGO|nr:unnamed protein product [Cylicostephanus goldi]